MKFLFFEKLFHIFLGEGKCFNFNFLASLTNAEHFSSKLKSKDSINLVEDLTNYILRKINGSIYINSSICRAFISSASCAHNKTQLIMNFHFYLSRSLCIVREEFENN